MKYCDTSDIELINKNIIYEYTENINPDESESKCMLCLKHDLNCEDDCMVYCDICNTSIHHACLQYTIDVKKKWICSSCIFYMKNKYKPKCEICGNNFDLLIPFKEDNNKFAHTYCAFYVDGYCVEEGEVKYENKAKIKQFGFLKCLYCKRKGGCVQCSQKECAQSFHISCCKMNGCFIDCGENYAHHYCHTHSIIESKKAQGLLYKLYKTVKINGKTKGFDNRFIDVKMAYKEIDNYIQKNRKLLK